MLPIQTQRAVLASTACWTASVRALENRREDRLFEDPFAESLAGQEGAQWIAQRTAESVVPIILRTRFFDDFLQRITTEHALRQIVIVAAGLDTRAFRLTWPEHTRLFELDQPAVLERKQRILGEAAARPTCERRTIAVDLTNAWEGDILAEGFDPEAPSGWLLEGLLFYLPDDTVTRLLDAITRLAATGSWLGFDVVNGLMLTSPLTRAWVSMQADSGAPWIGTMDQPREFLAVRGWNAAVTQVSQPGVDHGRWHYPVVPVEAPNLPHHWLITAQKM